MGAKYFGAAVLRREDPRFLRGEGRFVDDVTLPGLLQAAFLRSPHAHARIVAIRTERAKKMPGVVAVFTHADLARWMRSEEHTSELQSRSDLVCRLLLVKKKVSRSARTLLMPALSVVLPWSIWP